MDIRVQDKAERSEYDREGRTGSSAEQMTRQEEGKVGGKAIQKGLGSAGQGRRQCEQME